MVLDNNGGPITNILRVASRNEEILMVKFNHGAPCVAPDIVDSLAEPYACNANYQK